MDHRAPSKDAHGPPCERSRAGLLRGRAAVLVVLAVVLAPGLGQAWAQAGRVRADATVSLTDDAGGTALFPGTSPLSPGARQTSCLVVSAAGAAPGDTVTFAAESVSGALAPWIQLQVEMGSGGGHGNCAGFTGAVVFTGTLTDLAAVTGDGVATGWSPAATATRTFRISVDVTDDPRAQGLNAAAAFAWRLVSTTVTPPPVTPTPTLTPTPTPTLTATPTPSLTPTPTTSPADTTPTDVAPSTDLPPAPGTSPATSATSPTSPTSSPTGSPTGSPTTDAVVVPPGTTTPPPVVATGSAGAVDLWASAQGPLRTPRRGHQAPATGSRDSVPDVSLGSSLPQQVNRTLVSVVRDPAPLVWPAIIAVLFLLLQHRLDLRDPKLASAGRTGRELTLRFPTAYDAGDAR